MNLSLSFYEAASLAISGLGFGGIIASIFLLRHQAHEMTSQTKTLTESLQANAFQLAASLTADADRLFIANPEMRRYFYAGVPIEESDPQYERACAIAEYLLDLYSAVAFQRLDAVVIWRDPYWTGVITDTFARSPILYERLATLRDWYAPELWALAEESKRKAVQPVHQTTN